MKRAAAGHDLGAAVRDQVEGGELLPDADRVFGAEHGDGGGEPDVFGARGGGGEDGDRGRGDEIGAVVLAEAVEIEPDLIGELDLLEQVAAGARRAIAGGRRSAGRGCSRRTSRGRFPWRVAFLIERPRWRLGLAAQDRTGVIPACP